MFKRIFVDNYRNLVNFDLHLRELTLVVGANGVGKTSILDTVMAIRELLSGSSKISDQTIFPTKTLTRWQNRDRQVFELDVSLAEDSLVYRLEVEHDRKGRRARIASEWLSSGDRPLFEFDMGLVQLYRDDHSPGPSFRADWTESALARVAPAGDNTRLTNFLEFMRKVIVCGIYPASFETETSEEESILERDAHNFAAWFQHIQLERPDKVADFTTSLKDILHGFEGIRLVKVGLESRALMIAFRNENQKFELKLDEVSDGQRALIALYALIILAGEQGYTLLLDEPDNYISLQEIQPWLIQLHEACGDQVPQAILCSHHPELIDFLGPECGLLLSLETSGVVRISDLVSQNNDKPDIKLSERLARGWL